MPPVLNSEKSDPKRRIMDAVQIHVPFAMLFESHLELFLQNRINPEIALSADALERFSLTDFRNVAAQLHEHGLSVTLHAPFMDLSPGSPDPAVRALTRHRFEQMLELVPIFKPKTVVCHAGYDRKRYWPMRDAWIENSLEVWSWFGAGILNAGGRLMLENVYEHSPEDIRMLFEKLENQSVGFCLDTGHQAVFSTTSLEVWIESLHPYLGQLHLHDNQGSQDDHLALGQGKIDFQPIFNHLKNRRNEPPVITLEPHRESDLWLSIEYLESIRPW
jgi:sugar phosphate isomerase/epimerase